MAVYSLTIYRMVQVFHFRLVCTLFVFFYVSVAFSDLFLDIQRGFVAGILTVLMLKADFYLNILLNYLTILKENIFCHEYQTFIF